MEINTRWLLALLALGIFHSASVMVYAAQLSYHALKDIPVGGAGGFDDVSVDVEGRRLYVPHGTKVVVIDIDTAKLPSPGEVRGWTSEQYTSALRHVQSNRAYNSSLRQLLHVGFKVAAKMGSRYLDLLEANEAVIAKNVTENLYNRHIAPVFLGRNG